MAPGKGAGILISLGGKPKMEEKPEAGDAKGGARSAARALIKAVNAEDADGVVEAFGLLRDLCDAGEYESEED